MHTAADILDACAACRHLAASYRFLSWLHALHFCWWWWKARNEVFCDV